MNGYKDHRNALKPQNMKYEERINNLESKRKKNKQGLNENKLFPEGDTSLKDNLKLMQHGMNIEKHVGRPLSYSSHEEFANQIGEYFLYCNDHKMVPTRPGMALWLGVDSDTIKRWKNDPANVFSSIIKKADEYMHNFFLQKTAKGDINTILYFFIAKNWYGMSDKTEVVHKSSTHGIDIDEQQRIIDATPGIVIDAEIIESERGFENLGTNTLVENLDDERANLSVENLGTENLGTEDLESILAGEAENLGTENLEVNHKEPWDNDL